VTARALAAGFSFAVLGLTCPPAWAQEPLSVYVPTVDYPPDVRPNGSQHRVGLRYELDQGGRVAACTVVRRSGEPALDTESCHILAARARIRPEPGEMGGRLDFVWLGENSASDPPPARGEPLAYDLARRITYLDYPAEADGQSGTVSYEVSVAPNGVPAACTIARSSGVEALDRRTCDIVMTRGIFIPATDGNAPTYGVAHGRIRWMAPR
jgi:TonB family protein